MDDCRAGLDAAEKALRWSGKVKDPSSADVLTETTDTGIWATIREAPVAVKALLIGIFVNKLGWFLQVFLVLFLTTSKGFTDVQAGTALGIYGGGTVVGLIIGGSLSDKIGPRAAV